MPFESGSYGFSRSYGSSGDRLAQLYDKAARSQWIAGDVIRWDDSLADSANPLHMPDPRSEVANPQFWAALSPQQARDLSRNFQVWRISQIVHAEQAALLVCARLAALHQAIDAKACATMQAADEARHLDVFRRLLAGIDAQIAPVNPSLWRLVKQTLSDSRISVLCVGMQLMVEGVGLALFRRMAAYTRSPGLHTLFNYIVRDEARHFAMGRIVMADVEQIADEMPHAELVEFVDEALHLLDKYLDATDVLVEFGLERSTAQRLISDSQVSRQMRRSLFRQMVPAIADLQLLVGPVERRLASMNLLSYADFKLADFVQE